VFPKRIELLVWCFGKSLELLVWCFAKITCYLMSFHKNPKRCDLIRSLTSEKNMCIDHTMRCDHTISKKWTFVHTEISFHHYMNHCKINVDSVAHCRHRHPTKDGNPYGWLALDVLPPKRFSNVIKSGGFLSAPGRTFRVLIFTFRSP
jgi:hypothetical protein